MRFEVICAQFSKPTLERKENECTPLTRSIAKVYNTVLPAKVFGADRKLSRGAFRAHFANMDTEGMVMRACNTAAYVTLEIPDQIGLGMLILNGKIPKWEQRYCCYFMKRMAVNGWILPLPPLEAESRPLIYNVIFRLGPTTEPWDHLVEKLISNSHGLSVAVLEIINAKQEHHT